MIEAKKMKCYKRLTLEKLLQVSGLCGMPFLSYLPKRFTQLYRALYGDAILVYKFGTPTWPLQIDQTLTSPQSSSYSAQGERRERWVPRNHLLPYFVRNSSFAACYMKTTGDESGPNHLKFTFVMKALVSSYIGA